MKLRKKNKFYRICFNISESIYFKAFLILIVLINSITLAMDKYPVDMNELILIDRLNIVFVIIMLVERVLKLFAYGKEYFKDFYKIFHLIIVTIGVAEILYTQSLQIYTGNVATGLRCIRIFRAVMIYS
jgi:hypothetical protein